jgi:hypothetical protein
VNAHNQPPDVEKSPGTYSEIRLLRVACTATRGSDDPASLCSCTEGDPFGSPSGNTNCLPAHWRTSRVVRRCPVPRQSVPAGPLARTDDPRAFIATLRDPAPQTIVARSGFLLPRKPLPHNKPGEPSTLRSRQARQQRVPQPRRFHTHNPSGANEPCYVVLPLLQYFLRFTACFSAAFAAVRLAAVHRTALLLASHCFVAVLLVSCCSLLASCFLLPLFTSPISLPTREEPDMTYNKIYEKGARESSSRSLG